MSSSSPQDLELGCWSLSAVQHGGSLELLEQVFEETLPAKQRSRAARKLLRDGSRHTWFILLEYVQGWLVRHEIEASESPFENLIGPLRVKALKILWGPSRHEGKDHLSALKWLPHCIHAEDTPLICVLMKYAAQELPEALYQDYCLVASRIPGRLAAQHHIAEASQLLHTLLFEVPCVTPHELVNHLMPYPVSPTSRHAPEHLSTTTHTWFTDALLHAYQTEHDADVRTACICALAASHPDRFLKNLETFGEEISVHTPAALAHLPPRVTWLSFRLDHLMQRRARSISQLTSELDRLYDIKHESGPIKEILSDGSRHAPTLVLHAFLPHLLDYHEDFQGIILEYIAHIPSAIESRQLFDHFSRCAPTLELEVMLLSTCAHLHHNHERRHPKAERARGDLRRTMSAMLTRLFAPEHHTTWESTGQHTKRELVQVIESHAAFRTLALDFLTADERRDEHALLVLAQCCQQDFMGHHIEAEYTFEEKQELVDKLQRLHDRVCLEPLIMLLRKLLNQTRKLT